MDDVGGVDELQPSEQLEEEVSVVFRCQPLGGLDNLIQIRVLWG